MSDDTETVEYGVKIVRSNKSDEPTYTVCDRTSQTVLIQCGWLNVGTDQSFAFGGDGTVVEISGRVTVEPQGSPVDRHYPGATLHLDGM